MRVSDRPAFRPSRRRGQNFLVDRGIQRRIAQAAQLPPDAVVLEIGAGTGLLTEALRPLASRVIAVEVERELAEQLRERFAEDDSITVVNADAVALDIAALGVSDYHVVANLPFSVGTRLLIDLLQSSSPPQSLTVLLQRDVVDRACASPGEMRLLSVIVQSLARPQRLFDIPPGAFRPRPKVISTLVRLRPRSLDAEDCARTSRRIAAARRAFQQPRKQLANALGAPAGIDAALEARGIDPKRRPETLSLEEWDDVADALAAEATVAASGSPAT
ncbi:MAG: 16S rRNA (adenine(1518)-N(6)/adenine(1519)-N(6))-dimethyltransferase RsmA [Chloroflexota bacterium]|nr:16S rRNA (adenine(1518)-N(6)/adenine(1519)-N(6))-dimethyltransferase RsmA [Chloroflexota bacterium]